PLVLNTARIFLLVSLAYHSLMMLRKGVKSLSGVVRIHSIIDGDKPHAQFREADLRIKPDFQIVAPEAGHIFLCQVGTKKFLRFYKPFIGGRPPMNGL